MPRFMALFVGVCSTRYCGCRIESVISIEQMSEPKILFSYLLRLKKRNASKTHDSLPHFITACEYVRADYCDQAR